MKIRKFHSNIITLVSITILITGCAKSKEFNIDSKNVIVEPYGWANESVKRNDSVDYQVNAGNIVWSIIGCETIVLPIVLTGYSLYEPVRKK
jgi:hypothetical protein